MAQHAPRGLREPFALTARLAQVRFSIPSQQVSSEAAAWELLLD
jgi:hypothetical protein